MISAKYPLYLSFILAGFVPAAPAQSGPAQSGAAQESRNAAPANAAPSTYTLGPDDQLVVRVLDADEVSTDKTTPLRVDSRGNIGLPVIGQVRAAGLTPEELGREIERRLKKYILAPDVTVYLTEMRSQPISVLGAVHTPGVHQLQGNRNLFEVISLAGGLNQDAGYSVKITRRLDWGRIPLPDAKDDPTGQFSIASVDVKSILQAKTPEQNIQIMPNDVISVPPADLIYVVGAVKKAGGFVLGESETISALQALSLAEGLDPVSAPSHARIMREVAGSAERQQIAIDLRKVLSGRSPDLQLRAKDILFVPTNPVRNAAIRSLETGLQIGTGLAIYRIP